MIRFQRIGERTYRVVRNYGYLGVVAEPTLGRGWRYTLESEIPVEETETGYFTVRGFVGVGSHSTAAAAIRSATIIGGRTRTEAVHALLRARGLDPSQYRPASRRGQGTASAGARGRGRAFGVEMELTGPDVTAIMGALENAGIHVRSVLSYRATDGNSWELKHDGSVSGQGLELVSPKLRGEAGFQELETVCRALASVGATVDRSCGLHVHHDLRGLGLDSIKRQVLAFVDRQHLIRQLVAPSRRGNGYCPEWRPEQAQQLRDYRATASLSQVAYIGPRGAINLQSYARHGSVEIRYHGGTASFRKIAAWVRFGQALFAAAEAATEISTDDVDEMLSQLGSHGLTPDDRRTLLRFVEAARAAEARVEADEAVTV